MRIVEYRSENVKRLKAVEIHPDTDVVVVAGRNAQGKSSVLDSIWMALAGGSGAKETTQPIRHGESKASVFLDLGDLTVERRWTQKGTTLEVTAKDGSRYTSPQTVLDGLIGQLSFDPLAFAQQAPKEQLATLLSVVDLPFVPADLDAERAKFYERRTEVNRDVKRLQAQLEGLPAAPAGTPDEEVSAGDLMAQLAEAHDQARLIEETAAAGRTAIAQLEDLARQRAELDRKIVAAGKVVDDIAARAETLAAPADREALEKQIEEIDSTNQAVRDKKARGAAAAEHKAAVAKSDALTSGIEAIDHDKAEAIAAAQMPLEGLSFDEDGVLYNGVPFTQASAAERLRVGLAIAMALNPTIRVIRITDGSLLDSENVALIREMAAEHDFQIWLERVDESGGVGVTIEDGEVVPEMAAVA